MKVRKRNVGLYLTGGLGNQLFQFAAALSSAQEKEIRVFMNLGMPRLNNCGNPELFSFKIDEISSISKDDNRSFVAAKVAGYLLRSSIWPRRFEGLKVVRILTQAIAVTVHSLLLKDLIAPVTISRVGYEKIIINRFKAKIFNPLLIGYFQSSFWPEEVLNRLRTLSLSEEGPELRALRLQAQRIEPIIIHIRRGDYRSESTFGLPGREYYQRAYEITQERFPNNPIWVFSDEISEAQSILSFIPQARVQYIPDVDGASSASLMAMRFGCAYIIANSTFSWWGAFLSNSTNPLVIAPDPWFVGQADPTQLIPSNWIKIKHLESLK